MNIPTETDLFLLLIVLLPFLTASVLGKSFSIKLWLIYGGLYSEWYKRCTEYCPFVNNANFDAEKMKNLKHVENKIETLPKKISHGHMTVDDPSYGEKIATFKKERTALEKKLFGT